MPPEPAIFNADASPAFAAVFIYYRVADADGPALQAAFGRVMAASAAASIACPMLLRSALRRSPNGADPDVDEQQTWLEIWPADAVRGSARTGDPGIDWTLALRARIDEQIAHAGVAALIQGERHHEYFECA